MKYPWQLRYINAFQIWKSWTPVNQVCQPKPKVHAVAPLCGITVELERSKANHKIGVAHMKYASREISVCTQVCFKIHRVFTFAIRSGIVVKMTLEHLTRWMQAAVGSQCGIKTPNAWSNTYLHHKSLGCSNIHSFMRPRRLLEPQLKEAEEGAGRPRANGGAKRCEKKTQHKSCKAYPMTIRVSKQPQCMILQYTSHLGKLWSCGINVRFGRFRYKDACIILYICL